jgi:hypothetical protein
MWSGATSPEHAPDVWVELGVEKDRPGASVRNVKPTQFAPRSALSESYDRHQRYDGLYRYDRHHLHAATARYTVEFFLFLLPKQPTCVFGDPIPRFAYRELRGRYDENRPPVGDIRGPCFNGTSSRGRHSRIEASLYAHHTK